MAVAADTNVGKCGVGRERVLGTDMVGRLRIWMVGVATVAVEEIDCSYVAAFATAAARFRWGRCARSCRYNRCHCNNVDLPSGDDLTRGRR